MTDEYNEYLMFSRKYKPVTQCSVLRMVARDSVTSERVLIQNNYQFVRVGFLK